MTISSPGIGSGIDVNGIITKLVALEKRPAERLQTDVASLQSKISAWGQIKSALSTLRDATDALAGSDLWNKRKVSSTNEAAVSASATGLAPLGIYDLQVNQLATSQSTLSRSYAASTALGQAGRLDIRLGTWSGSTFSASSSAVSVSIEATDTLSSIANKINSANAGVQAAVVREGSTERLLVIGSETGTENGFEITAYDGSGAPITDGSTPLGGVSYFNNGGAVMGMTLRRAAGDAEISFEGTPLTSSTNTFENVIDGLTITAKAVTSSPVSLTVERNDTDATKAVETFVSSYNKLSSLIKDLTKTSSDSSEAGVLRGDQTAIGIRTLVRSYTSNSVPGLSSLESLADIGISIDRDGVMSLDSSKLQTTLTDSPFEVSQLFNASGTGIASTLKTFLNDALSFDGSVGSRTTSLQDTVKRKNEEIAKVNERASRLEARLLAQYTALDTRMASLNGLSSFISQQLASWNR